MMSYNRGYSKNNYTKKPYVKKAVTAIAPNRNRIWSDLQKNIFSFMETSNGSAFIEALAGTGKTTTLEETARRLYEKNPKLKIAVIAFSRDIKAEVAARLVDIKAMKVATSHSLGFSYTGGRLDNDKMFRILGGLLGPDQDKDFIEQLRDCISKMKLTMSPMTPEAVDFVLDKYDINIGTGSEKTRNIATVLRAMEESKNQKLLVDYDDMLWMALQNNKVRQNYDIILVDEVQDFNRAQYLLIKGALKPGGRIIAFGDRHQRIYSFAGADENVIDNLIADTNATILPLSISYRCPKKVVELAQEIVPAISAAENAPDGEVRETSIEDAMVDVKPGDFFLSRKNAPLIRICMKLLQQGTAANIRGADISKGLLWMIKKSQANTVSDLMNYLETWRASEIQRLSEKNRRYDWVDDKADCLLAFCAGAGSVEQVKASIRRTFTEGDSSSRVTMSSAHRAKGSETDRVFVLNDTFNRDKSQEENNLLYVAWTRARKSLFIVNGMP